MSKLLLFCAAFLFLPALCWASGGVLINEIAWMGSTSSSYNEWIELSNTTSQPVSLTGWSITATDLKIPLSGTIAPNGFFVLARKYSGTSVLAHTDLQYSGALNNSGADLKLTDNTGSLIDEANFTSGWPAGDNKTKQTTERDAAGWHTSLAANGTPGQQNDAGVVKVVATPAAATAVAAAPVSYPSGVFINELMPYPDAPVSENEWIELYNSNPVAVNVAGWTLKATTTKYKLPAGSTIAADGYLSLKRPDTKLLFHKEKETVVLLQPNGNQIDSVSYENATRNEAYSKIDGKWQWDTNPTPGAENVAPATQQALPNDGKSAMKESENKTAALENAPRVSSTNPWAMFFITGGVIVAAGAGWWYWKYRQDHKS